MARFTPDQVQSMLAGGHVRIAGEGMPNPVKKRNKYGAKKTWVDGICFDSKKEADDYRSLVLLQKAGQIRYFIRQPLFDLGGEPTQVHYKADFLIVGKDGSIRVVDVKGKDTQASKNKRKQVKALYGIDVELA